jgi:hypothetical protein
MLRMQEMVFPGFKFQKFSRGASPGPPRLCGASSFWDYATVRFLAGSAPVGGAFKHLKQVQKQKNNVYGDKYIDYIF